MAARVAGKKSERTAAQNKALEETKIDPAVSRLQVTLEENLDFFMNHIAGMIKDLNAKLDGARTAALAAHASMGISLATSLMEAQLAQGDGATINGDDGGDDDKAAAAQLAAIVTAADADRAKAAAAAATAGAAASAGGDEVVDAAAAAPATDATAAPAAADAAAADAAPAPADGDKIEISFPDNTRLLDQLRLLKKDAYALGTTFDGIHDWVALNIPDFKADDNVSVEVMGAVIQQVSSLQESIRDVYSSELKYLEDRAELEKGLLKMPENDTVRRQMELLDLDTWDDVEKGWRAMIRSSLILFTMLRKNMKVLREPKKQKHNLFM